jgi:hypothetical protein
MHKRGMQPPTAGINSAIVNPTHDQMVYGVFPDAYPQFLIYGLFYIGLA